jgi:hypothetical protein
MQITKSRTEIASVRDIAAADDAQRAILCCVLLDACAVLAGGLPELGLCHCAGEHLQVRLHRRRPGRPGGSWAVPRWRGQPPVLAVTTSVTCLRR